MITFCLPDLGEGLQEAEIVDWHVSVGDRVVADQPLVSVETEKAIVEIPSPQSGEVRQLYGKSGDIKLVGDRLADFATDAHSNESGSVVGELPTDTEPQTLASQLNDGAADIAHDQTASRSPRRSASGSETSMRPKMAPATRRLANELGVDLGTVIATGKDALATEADVRRALEYQAAPDDDGTLRGPRRAMARAMASSRDEVVPATVTCDASVHLWSEGTDPTVRLVLAIISGCRAEPALNAWFDSANLRRRIHNSVDLGIAIDAETGLFVPVLRHAERLDVTQIRAAIDRFKSAAKSRSIEPSDLRGPTITMSNFGTLIGRYASLVIVPPQVAILGAGRIADQVLAIEGVPTVRPVMPLSLSFDHRVITGAEATRFLSAVSSSLESLTGESQ